LLLDIPAKLFRIELNLDPPPPSPPSATFLLLDDTPTAPLFALGLLSPPPPAPSSGGRLVDLSLLPAVERDLDALPVEAATLRLRPRARLDDLILVPPRESDVTDDDGSGSRADSFRPLVLPETWDDPFDVRDETESERFTALLRSPDARLLLRPLEPEGAADLLLDLL